MLRKVIIGFAIILPACIAHARGDDSKKTEIAKASQLMYDFISVNNIMMYLANNGDMAFNPTTAASGLEWPKGSGKTVVYEDSIVWGGYVGGELRVGGSAYRHALQPGPYDASGIPANPQDQKHRLYKVRKVTEQRYRLLTLAEQNRMRKDYTEWPVDNDAPFTDRNGVPGYQPNFDRWLAEQSISDLARRKIDEPLMIGDEVLWCVMNDGNASLTNNFCGTKPIGIECQLLVWGYEKPGPLGNMIFTKYRLINKGAADFTDVYLSRWSDPDLGDANDDFVGVDSASSLGFAYNGLVRDQVYGVPPAVGYDFLQGPIVPSSPTDTAQFNFSKRGGYRNLPMTSFIFYIGGNSTYRDPMQGQLAGAVEMYNYQCGLLWNKQPYLDPTTNKPTKFALSGDPIARRGWSDGIPAGPGDRRILMTTGPFTMKKGDVQEMIVATIVARGIDRLGSVQELRHYDTFAQTIADINYEFPQAPPSPKVRAIAGDRRITLTWGNQAEAKLTESFRLAGWKFQGYNVYQFPSSSSMLSDAKRLATFDVVDNVATVVDDVVDEKSGTLVAMPVQFGTDSDISRQFIVTMDELKGEPLVNNQPYYFAVTAYSYNSAEPVFPRSFESSPEIFEVRPQTMNPGWRSTMRVDTALPIEHLAGSATGSPEVRIIDPMKCTGHDYEVTLTSPGSVGVPFDDDGDPVTPEVLISLPDHEWTLTDKTKNMIVIEKATLFGRDNAYEADGFRIGMNGLPHWMQHHEIASRTWVNAKDAESVPVFDASNAWDVGEYFFGSAIPPWEVRKDVRIRFDRSRSSKGYMYLRGATPNYEFRGYFESPVTFWDVSDSAHPRQLSYAFVEQVGSAFQNNEWNPGTSAADREYCFIIDEPYSDLPNPKYTGSFRINSSAASMPILYAGWYYRRSSSSNEKYPWKDGDGWIVKAQRPFSRLDVFQFKTNAPMYSDATARADVAAVQVFPNPYFGNNAQELNKHERFVTFNHLPPDATIRIYTLAGTHVRTIDKSQQQNQYATWDLRNDNGLPVGSGMYLVHIDMPTIGAGKVLTLAVILEAQFLDRL